MGDLLEGSRTLLRMAGLPTMFWPWAAKCYCLHENIGTEDSDDSPWFMTHAKHFKGERVPFGCALRYLPNKTKTQKQKSGKVVYKDKQAKWDARSRIGVFMGYDMKPGYQWSGRYLVMDLDAFQDANLFATTDKCLKRWAKPHKVRRIRFPVGEITFPLKAAYVQANDTLEGRSAAKKAAAEDAEEVPTPQRKLPDDPFAPVENVTVQDGTSGPSGCEAVRSPVGPGASGRESVLAEGGVTEG